MSPVLILSLIVAYFALLIGISRLTGKSDDNETFFTGKRQSPWFVVAFGMIGASLSGVTFISVPGWVEARQFSYMQMVMGYLLGYFVIAKVLLPVYYRLNLTSIYTYLEGRFGVATYKTGALFFLLSRVVGASLRLFLVAIVLQTVMFDAWDVPFWVTVSLTILLIWLYTNRGGIKTIVYTDTLQTLFMLLAVGITLYVLKDYLLAPGQSLTNYIAESEMSQIWFFDNFKLDTRHFVKQFFAGMFITITMTGLDQDMMQKNLTCRSLKDAQKNMLWFSLILVFVNLLFLSLGVLLYDYAAQNNIDFSRADTLYPTIAMLEGMPTILPVLFIIGLIAAAYSSADSALTSLTTSFCVDILGINKKTAIEAKALRKRVHIGISLVLLLVILMTKAFLEESVIEGVFLAATFTYGPLLGLYAFGLFTKFNVKDRWVPIVALASPILSYLLKIYGKEWWGYNFSFELLIINGMLTFVGLLLLVQSKKR